MGIPLRGFVSYKYTGLDEKIIGSKLSPIIELWESKLEISNMYCNFFDPDLGVNWGPEDYMSAAFKEIDKSDFLFAYVDSRSKSEGMLMEVGYAIAKNKQVVVAMHGSITDSYLHRMADLSLHWDSNKELYSKITSITF